MDFFHGVDKSSVDFPTKCGVESSSSREDSNGTGRLLVVYLRAQLGPIIYINDLDLGLVSKISKFA